MIEQNTIDEIFNRADIVEVVSEFVSLHKAGVNYKGLCPFHNEKTPSFVVSPAKGICHCFSCGKGGNPVHFLMEHEQITFTEALRWLANKYNIPIKEKDVTPEELMARGHRESLFIVNEWACKYFQDNLYNTEEGKTYGLSYFRKRGLRDDIIAKFQLGYCLSQSNMMASKATSEGYQKEYLIETGLCSQRDNGTLYDKYHGRVIYPVRSLSGKVVAFGGRILGSDSKAAKYINSPESDIYHKSYELYGIHQAKRAIQQKDRCYLVEGYMDVISMHQCGIENVVASSGTSLTEGQIRMIHRFTNNITVLYDGDSAGIHASLRGINMLLSEGMNVKVLLLPDGDDPDSFAQKKSASEYTEYIESHQEDFITFKIRILSADAKDDIHKKADVVNNIIESVSCIPDAVTRSVYLQECSRLLNMKEEILIRQATRQREINKGKQQKPRTEKQNGGEETTPSGQEQDISQKDTTSVPFQKPLSSSLEKIEFALVSVIVRYGEHPITEIPLSATEKQVFTVIDYIKAEFETDGIGFRTSLYAQVWEEAIGHCHDKDFKASSYFVSLPDLPISKLAADILGDDYQLSSFYIQENIVKPTEDKLSTIVPSLILKLKLCIVSNECKEILKEIQSLDSSSSEYLKKMERYSKLLRIKKNLSVRQGATNISL